MLGAVLGCWYLCCLIAWVCSGCLFWVIDAVMVVFVWVLLIVLFTGMLCFALFSLVVLWVFGVGWFWWFPVEVGVFRCCLLLRRVVVIVISCLVLVC